MAAKKKGNGKASNGASGTIPAGHLRQIHDDILRIRRVEERLTSLLKQGGRWSGPLFPSRGQEAVVASVLLHLKQDDWVSPTPRELGAHLLRGMPLRDLFAHFAGAETSPMRGHDGGGRLGSLAAHTTPSIASTASNFAVGMGVALSFQLRKQRGVAVGYFGDAVMNTGCWHEVINMVAVMRCPYVMICNNNGYGFATPAKDSCLVVELGERAIAYGVDFVSVDGTDVEAVYNAAHEAIGRAREGQGGMLIECRTPRLGGYSLDEPMPETIDTSLPDVLSNLQARLLESGQLSQDTLAALEGEIQREIEDAVKHAESLPVASGTDAVLRGVYGGLAADGDGKVVPNRLHPSEHAARSSETPRQQWVFNDFE